MSCQLTNIPEVGIEKSLSYIYYQKLIRLLQKIKGMVFSLKIKLKRMIFSSSPRLLSKNNNMSQIKAGDMVKVKTKKEIQGMLDERGKYKGCSFIGRMYEYCGNTYKVLKDVNYFYDEAKQKMCKCRNIILLEEVTCTGKQKLFFESCDRSCFYFWHVDWLEKLEQVNKP